MNWTWRLRSRDGGMNGLEFSECLTAGDQRQVLVHAAPAGLSVEVRDDDGHAQTSQVACESFADPRGRAGDDGGTRGESLCCSDIGHVARRPAA